MEGLNTQEELTATRKRLAELKRQAKAEAQAIKRGRAAIENCRKSSTPFAVTYEAATLPSGRAKLL